MSREEIQVKIDKILREKELAKASLRGREYVWPSQIRGRRRLFKRLDEKLVVLKEQLDALAEKVSE